MMDLPPALSEPPRIGAVPAFKVLKELVFYHDAWTVDQFDGLLDLWACLAPEDRQNYFTISEFDWWSRFDDPVLTRSARRAAQKGVARPMFEPQRIRLREARAIRTHIWDGLRIGDPPGSFSMEIRRFHLRESGFHGFVRMLFPIDFPDADLVAIARSLASHLPALSGHGGPVFTYEPAVKHEAFGHVFGRARRFSGIDVEDLRLTLTAMRACLHPPCWLNFIGTEMAARIGLDSRYEPARASRDIKVFDEEQGVVFQLGESPACIDRNRREDATPYKTFAAMIAGHIVGDIGDFHGEGFMENPGTTDAWFRRFLPGSEWYVGALLPVE